MAKHDVILLSDTRVVSSQGVSSTERINNALRDSSIKKYNILFNSSSNSRGTAIILAADLDYVVNLEYKDTGENYYILDITISGLRYCIGSVYGPNNTCREFYRNLNAVLSDVYNRAEQSPRIILGGDWNTVVDRNPLQVNIDVFCMSAIPNPKNSELLDNLCERFNLSDPYRIYTQLSVITPMYLLGMYV
jgi:exonuclease III